MVLGGLIVAFDYPQIRYIEEMDGHVVSSATMQVYERLVVEFYIGTAMLTGGALVGAWGVVSGMLKKRTVQ